MDAIKNSISQVTEAITSSTKSGAEPVSGVKGAGTVEQPYDQGNAEEQATSSGTEPPSGITGAGRAEEPYDQGNAPEQGKLATTSTEPPSGIQGKGTIEQPFDQGNAPEQTTSTTESSSGLQDMQTEQPATKGIYITLSRNPPIDPYGSPSTTHQGSGNPTMEPTKAQEQVLHEQRGRDETAQRTTSTPPPVKSSTGTAANGGDFDAAKPGAGQQASRLRYEERDVSPGEMRDGTHAVTDGEKGLSYQPGKMNKLKDKFHIGRSRD